MIQSLPNPGAFLFLRHSSLTLTAVLVDGGFFLKRAARIYGLQTPYHFVAVLGTDESSNDESGNKDPRTDRGGIAQGFEPLVALSGRPVSVCRGGRARHRSNGVVAHRRAFLLLAEQAALDQRGARGVGLRELQLDEISSASDSKGGGGNSIRPITCLHETLSLRRRSLAFVWSPRGPVT
jgi:hypothetical protein